MTQATDVIQGMDVVVSVVGAGGPMLSTTVGGFQELDATLTHTASAYPELNEQWDLMLPGKFSGRGTVRRGWMDAAAIARFLGGQTTVGRGIRTVPPKFSVTFSINAPGKADHGRRAQFTNCSFDSMAWTARSAEASVDNPLTFTAEGYQLL